MSDFVQLGRQIIAAGKNGHVSSSWMQFPDYFKKLDPMQEKMQNFEADSEIEVNMRRVILEVKHVPPYYMGALGNYQNGLCKKELFHSSVAEPDCHV